MRYDVEEAQDKFELLMAMAFIGEEVLIENGNEVVKLEPIPRSVDTRQSVGSRRFC